MSNLPVVHWLRGAFLFLLTTVLLVSCGERKASTNDSLDGKAPISGAFPSLEALAQEVVSAIEDSSYERLMACRVTEEEYRDVLWAGLPKEELGNYPIEKAWRSVEQDCVKSAHRILYDFGGQDLELAKVYVAKEVREYPTLKVIRGLRMVIQVENGETMELDLVNVVLETNNKYKVIAYNS